MPHDIPARDNPIPLDEYTSHAKRMILQATARPYDGRPSADAAHLTAQAVLADLQDRRGLGQVLSGLDDDVREEITEVLAAIVREVATPASGIQTT